jgi:hypothetical protein
MIFEIWIIPAVLSPRPHRGTSPCAADISQIPSAEAPDAAHAASQRVLRVVDPRRLPNSAAGPPSGWSFTAGTLRDASGTLGDASGVSTGGAYSVILLLGGWMASNPGDAEGRRWELEQRATPGAGRTIVSRTTASRPDRYSVSAQDLRAVRARGGTIAHGCAITASQSARVNLAVPRHRPARELPAEPEARHLNSRATDPPVG